MKRQTGVYIHFPISYAAVSCPYWSLYHIHFEYLDWRRIKLAIDDIGSARRGSESSGTRDGNQRWHEQYIQSFLLLEGDRLEIVLLAISLYNRGLDIGCEDVCHLIR